MAYSCGGFGAALVLFAFSRSFWLSTAVLVPVGFCMMLQMASSNTLIQTMVPDHLRGRVMSGRGSTSATTFASVARLASWSSS